MTARSVRHDAPRRAGRLLKPRFARINVTGGANNTLRAQDLSTPIGTCRVSHGQACEMAVADPLDITASLFRAFSWLPARNCNRVQAPLRSVVPREPPSCSGGVPAGSSEAGIGSPLSD